MDHTDYRVGKMMAAMKLMDVLAEQPLAMPVSYFLLSKSFVAPWLNPTSCKIVKALSTRKCFFLNEQSRAIHSAFTFDIYIKRTTLPFNRLIASSDQLLHASCQNRLTSLKTPKGDRCQNGTRRSSGSGCEVTPRHLPSIPILVDSWYAFTPSTNE